MTYYIDQRLVLLPVLLLVYSFVIFAIIQVPPGDFLTSYVATLSASGTSISAEQVQALRHEYGLDQSFIMQYLRWLQNLFSLTQHIWLPAVVLGVAGTARLTRITRANLLDELNKPYVVTARAKAMREWRLVLRYPVRLALNPLVSTIGWYLPQLFSGSLIVATVMNLPNIGPLLFRALVNRDMYLAGAILLIYSFLTIVGTLLSDVLLALIDPRIRMER
jgi:ABC-type dipeptide/oligopeptide/nickel transport system permease component